MRPSRICSLFARCLFLCFPLALAIRAGDFWSGVTSLDAYEKVPPCAQSCIRDVNSATNCVDYSCVCSDHSSGGTNFITGVANISDCAEINCQSEAAANTAVNNFRDICLIAQSDETGQANTTGQTNTTGQATVTTGATAANTATGLPSSPLATLGISHLWLIKPESYESLNPCSKFCLNGCRDINGTVDEANCYTDKYPDGESSYRGLADNLSCTDAPCLCAGVAFNLTYWRLFQESASFCGYSPTTSDQDSPEYDRLQGALADYCSSQNYTPAGYLLPIVGQDSPSGLDTSDKIGLGVGVSALGLAIPALCFQGYSTYLAWRTFKGS